MPSAPPSDAPDELAASEAGTAYWREVARQRRVDAADVQRRPLVRAAIALDRRTRSLQTGVAGRMAEMRAAGRRSTVRAGALAARRQRVGRREHLQSVVGELVGDDGDRAAVDVVEVGTPASVGEVVDACRAPVICLAAPTVEPLHAGWATALAAALGPDVAASTPQVVHPERPQRRATGHDLLVRWEGISIAVGGDGVPTATSARAAAVPTVDRKPISVDAAGPTAVAMTRATWDDIGGLDPSLPPDAALVELSLRAALATNSDIVAVPRSLVADLRDVTDPDDLVTPLPVGSPSWRTIVERHGPALVRRAKGDAPTSFAITTATPSRKIAPRSGDWHFAGGLAAALGRAGHRVRMQTIDEADHLAARSCDVHLVLRGLEPVRRTSGQRHVLWVISHPEALEVAECDEADLVLVASSRYAEHLRRRTTTPVEVMLQATDQHHFAPVAPDPRHRHPITVVANTRGVERRAVADAVEAGIDVAIYGTGWNGVVDPALLAGEYVAHEALPVVYASADLVLNDHWDTMRRSGFVSNRIFDVLATGTAVASDHLPEIEAIFGDAVPTWNDPDELAALVTEMRADPTTTAARVAAGRDLVLGAHTFDHRVTELLDHLDRHRLVPRPPHQEPHP